MPPPRTKSCAPSASSQADAGRSRRRRRTRGLALVSVALLAASLRLWGIGWGLPNPQRFYPYHPDESVVILAVAQLNPFRGEFLPHFYNYGSLYLILSRAAVDVAAAYGLVKPDPPIDPERTPPDIWVDPGRMAVWVHDFARMILIGRLVAVALAVGTVLLAWAAARRLYGRRCGWLAALFLAVAPMHVVLAHYMAVDVPAGFFFNLCLLLCAHALPAPGPPASPTVAPSFPLIRSRGWRWFWIGFTAGLAAGTKYNAGLVLAAALVPLTAASPPWQGWRAARKGAGRLSGLLPPAPRGWLAGLALLGAGAAAGLLLSTPGIYFERKQFLLDFNWEVGHSGRGHGDLFKALPPAAIYHLATSLSIGLGWTLLLAGLAGAACAAWRHRARDVLLLAAILPYYAVLARSELRFLRYVVPLLPPLAILGARFVVGVAALARHRGRTAGRVTLWALGAAAFLPALAASVAHVRAMAAGDPRDAAAQWLLETTRPGQCIALAADPWFRTPPVHPTAGCVKKAVFFGGPPVWEPQSSSAPDRILRPQPLGRIWLLAPQGSCGVAPRPQGPLPVGDLDRYRPDRVVISDYEYADPLRIRRSDAAYSRTDATLKLWDELQRTYVLEREFRVRPELFGYEWFGAETPPHDWSYYMPTIQVYRRR
jgi:hypothetical protein